MSAIGGPTAMMIDIAQVQPGFELQTLVPATTLVMFTLGGFGLRNEIKGIAKDLSADIKDISNQVNENLERCACLSTHVCSTPQVSELLTA
jgi:hypothetical protein